MDLKVNLDAKVDLNQAFEQLRQQHISHVKEGPKEKPQKN
jgi:hypothetical protein